MASQQMKDQVTFTASVILLLFLCIVLYFLRSNQAVPSLIYSENPWSKSSDMSSFSEISPASIVLANTFEASPQVSVSVSVPGDGQYTNKETQSMGVTDRLNKTETAHQLNHGNMGFRITDSHNKTETASHQNQGNTSLSFTDSSNKTETAQHGNQGNISFSLTDSSNRTGTAHQNHGNMSLTCTDSSNETEIARAEGQPKEKAKAFDSCKGNNSAQTVRDCSKNLTVPEEPGKPNSALSSNHASNNTALDRLPNQEKLKNQGEILKRENEVNSRTEKKETKPCDIYSGTWIKDDKYPLYSPGSCPYVDEAFACHENGRSDTDYMKWRWKPNECQHPGRFNAVKLLEGLRGRRLVFVGDSMNRNQFESMLCLLHEGLQNKSRMYEIHGLRITKGTGFYIFKFADYDCTVEYARTHFLVKEGRQVKPNGRKRPTLMLDTIDKHYSRWSNADILIFNTGHWWNHGKTSKGKDYFQEGGVVYPKLDVLIAFRKAMMTWARWIDENINSNKTTVFFRSYSPAHYKGGEWNAGGKCNKETQPLTADIFSNDDADKTKIIEDVIKQMRTPVRILNISRLTYFRKDGHPSIYGKHYTSLEEMNRARYQDCSHWCLPGIPDTWNEIVYSILLRERL